MQFIFMTLQFGFVKLYSNDRFGALKISNVHLQEVRKSNPSGRADPEAKPAVNWPTRGPILK